MPIVDMPLEKLKEYKGRNPKPADFDEYWERALGELDRTPPDVELVKREHPANFADCFDMYFTGVRGARIYAKYLRPKNSAQPHPAVLFFHGYSGGSGDFLSYLSYVAQGYSVAAMDCRGQGGRSEDAGGVKGNTLHGHIIRGLDGPPEDMLMRHIFLDTAELARVVAGFDEVDGSRIAAAGGSQGGGLTLACASLFTELKMAAPRVPFLCDYKRVWEMDLAKGAYAEIRDYFRRFDPRHEREDEIFEKLGYIDASHLAARIRAEVMMSVGLMDTTCPPSTQFAAFNRINSKKRTVIYPDFSHEGLPGIDDMTFELFSRL